VRGLRIGSMESMLNLKPRPHADVIKAWADGAEIECWDDSRKEWYFQARPSFWTKSKYRIRISSEPRYRLARMQMPTLIEYIAVVQTATEMEDVFFHSDFCTWLTDWKSYDY
jgi:hypothetical protein